MHTPPRLFLNRHGRFDMRMGFVVDDLKVIKHITEDVLGFALDI
jgi:hypothetical protein